MTDKIYEELTVALNNRGGSLPCIKCEEFYELASELFTPEEAYVAVKMPLWPVSAEVLGKEIAYGDPSKLKAILEKMADKGLLFSHEKDGVTLYNLFSLLPGIFEYQFMRGEVNDYYKNIARLFDQYIEVAKNKMVLNVAAASVLPARVIAVEKEVKQMTEIHPYDIVSGYINNAAHIAVSHCYCRHHGELIGNPCDRPKEVCFSFGTTAKFNSDRGFGRLVSKQEALGILKQADDAGLVHCSGNTGKYIDWMCNCCSCHCIILRNILNSPIPVAVAKSSFEAVIVEEECIGCGDCIERCQTKALSLNKDAVAVKKDELCIGCGLCISICPTGALKLQPRKDAPVPPADRNKLTEAMLSLEKE
ncbi:MAG: 4Fe-4S dicluster domain-containing protein [Dehalococcoidia bacterium]|nr:4Fe-4S dicluster domain-containing protein [Dehalococcoidia bacterium]